MLKQSVTLFLFTLGSLVSNAQTSTEILNQLYTNLEGTFIIKERPDDFKVNFVWVNTAFKSKALDGSFIYHKRVLSHAPDKPLVQLLIEVEELDGKPTIKWYAFKSSEIETKLASSKNLDADLASLKSDEVIQLSNQNMSLSYSEGVFEGSASYKTSFRGSEFGVIEMKIQSDEIYNWTRYFKKDSSLVYGPKEKGYILKRSSN